MGKVRKAAEARRERRAKRTKKHRIRNLSMRMSFMLYVAVFAVAAFVLVIGTLMWLSQLQSEIYYAYEQVYYDPDTGVRLSTLQAMPQSERDQYALYNTLMMLSMPFWIIICLVSASYLFYKKKLREPIRILTGASEKIAQSDLDFTIAYDRQDEMGRLCDSFETMRTALQASHREMWRAMEERKRLNAAFSHDLRTPLTVLHGYADMLGRHLPRKTLPAEKIEETVAAMSAQIGRLERYVENMNTLQRLEDVAVLPEPVATTALTDALRDTATAVCRATGKALDFEAALTDRPLVVDLSLVMQVTENLLSNAARYARGEVRVCAAAAGNLLSITVSDDGPGFTEETLRRAMEPFYSGEEADSAHFGLGLNIAAILCERHGGTLALANSKRGGGRVEAIFLEKAGLL